MSLRGVVYGSSALAGAATMVVELSAVRAVAPWFGTSSGVWTNAIGVILLALAIGYLAGARAAASSAPGRVLAHVLLASAVFTALLPVLARPVCGLFMPAELGLDRAAELFVWGSLASTLILFLPAAICLGCAAPLAVEVLARSGTAHAGSAGGRILCLSTFGSLLGCFATTHVFLPRLGITWTFLSAAAALALAGGMLAVASRANAGAAAASLVLFAGVFATSRLSPPALPAGVELLERAESAYQSLRAVEDRRGPAPMRLLQVNEGLDSFQSVWVPEPGRIGDGYYYDFFALPAWWAGAQGPWRCAVLGLGAGTALRVLDGASPPGCTPQGYGIEIDSRAVELGLRWFELDESSARWTIASEIDARAGLRCLPRELDLVVLDAYAHQVEIPAHLSTVEFAREIREHLAPGGWLAANVGGFGFDDPVVAAMARTIAAGFERACLVLRVPRSRNYVIFARRDAEVPGPTDAAFLPDGSIPRALLAPLALDGGSLRVAPGEAPWRAPLLTDDKNPIDSLQRLSLEEASARTMARS